MEGDRVQAVAGASVTAYRTAEVCLADAVEVNRGIGRRICQVAGAATGDTICLKRQVVGRNEVHTVSARGLDRVVLDVDRPAAEGRPQDRLIGAALEGVSQKFEAAPGRGPWGPGVTRVDPVVTGARAGALEADRIDSTELAGADIDRRRVDGDAV